MLAVKIITPLLAGIITLAACFAKKIPQQRCCAEFDIIRENINAKNKTTNLRGSPINWLRPREEGEQFYYGEARTEL